jgi:hypothetical protein
MISTRIALASRLAWILAGALIAELGLAGPGRAAGLDLETVKKTLHELKERGEQPEERAFLKLAYPDGRSLPSDDFWAAWRYLGSLQKPPIAIRDLANLIQTKRESIADFSVKYKVEHNGTPTAVSKEDVDLAFAGNQYYLRIHYQKPPKSTDKVWDVLSGYDGKVLRQLFPQDDRSSGHASITALDTATRERFLQTTSNPLAVSMLIDSVALCGKSIPVIDLVGFLKDDAVLFDKRVVVRGTECLVASNLLQRVFIDPKRDYAVMQIEDSTMKDGVLHLSAAQFFDEQVDHGNGVWLPHKISRHFFNTETGREKFSSLITVAKIGINEGVKSQLFSDIIPDGVLVGDVVRTITYVQGDQRSIEQALRGSVPDALESPHRAKWWMIGVNSAAGVGLVVYLVMLSLRRSAGRA